eukprot:TRINITY_DN2985_c0_g1_i1.p1 TRINITY_DN2985_c0_g1~~TRINITY_DN2985_c0_g1_i1.p1  ORF type:complete len:361 (-),score=48.64 TRINITY_DN2985_c0_g1_i1:28-1110(-)
MKATSTRPNRCDGMGGALLLGSEQIGMITVTALICLIVILAICRKLRQLLNDSTCLWQGTGSLALKISSPNLSNNGGRTSKDKTPKVASMLRYLVYLASVGYALTISITQVLGPQLTSVQCKYVGKLAFTLFSTQKLFLYAFLLAKARVVQVVMQPRGKLTTMNIVTAIAIICVLCYPIASWITFDGTKIPTFSNCIFITPPNFYVLFIVAAVHDTALSVALLVEFIGPLEEHLLNFKTMKLPTRGDDENGVQHLRKVVRVNTLFGLVSMISTIVAFSLMAWITWKRDLYLASSVLPLSSLADLLLSTASVFVITTPELWNYVLCISCSSQQQQVKILSPAQHSDPEETTPLKRSAQQST